MCHRLGLRVGIGDRLGLARNSDRATRGRCRPENSPFHGSSSKTCPCSTRSPTRDFGSSCSGWILSVSESTPRHASRHRPHLMLDCIGRAKNQATADSSRVSQAKLACESHLPRLVLWYIRMTSQSGAIGFRGPVLDLGLQQ